MISPWTLQQRYTIIFTFGIIGDDFEVTKGQNALRKEFSTSRSIKQLSIAYPE